MKLLKKIDGKLLAAEGTSFAVLAAFLIKGIGVLYKIPLYNFLGDKATGLYGMIFPLFSFLLCVAGGSAPSVLTKIISDGYDSRKTLALALSVFCPIAAVLSGALYVFAERIAFLQGAPKVFLLYRAIAPSVFLVSLICVLRGYFQGLSNMKPTAISRLIEQIVRAGVGLSVCIFLSVGAEEKARLAVVGITISELSALAYCALAYFGRLIKVEKGLKPPLVAAKSPTLKLMLSFALPLTIADLLVPLSAFSVETIAVRALTEAFGEKGLGIYGLYAGAAESIICLPSAVLQPLTAGLLPKMRQKGVSELAVLLCAAVGAAAGAFCFFFPRFIVELLFSHAGEKALLVKMIRLSSLSVLALPILQTLSAIMLSHGRQNIALIDNAIGSFVKISVCYALVKQSATSVFALAISDICCYFVALTLNLLYIINKINVKKSTATVEKKAGNDDNVGGARNGQTRRIFGRVEGD